MSNLTPSQNQAVHAKGHCLIVASPGSGKTRTLVAKAAYLVRDNPKLMVLAVTFTNKSATELKERISHEAGAEGAKRCNVGTFHSICKQQVEKGLGARLNILTGAAQDALIRRAMEAADYEGKIEDARQAIEAIKARLNRSGAASAADEYLLEEYSALLERNNQVDMQDLIILAVKAMQDGRLKAFPHKIILVDEFQDTDTTQYEWVKLHAAAGALITVVGDDDQSIYAWRAAMGYDGMSKFKLDHDAEMVVLGTNYRSKQEVLIPAAKLIGRNESRMAKDLVSVKGAGGRVRCYRFANEDQESASIVNEIRDNPSQWAVLARNNWVLDNVESTLSTYGIPYYRGGGGGFWKLRVVMLYLTLVQSLARISNQKAGIDQVLHWVGITEAELAALHTDYGADLTAIPLGKVKVPMHKENASRLASFLSLYRSWQSNINRDRIPLTLLGIANWMAGFAKGKKGEQDERETKRIMAACEILSRQTGSISQRVASATRYTDNKQQEGVALLTMHASKGLEFPCVWIARSEDGVVPNDKAPLSEERRLFYVAMTRAMDELVISATMAAPVSPFVPESGLAMVDIMNVSEPVSSELATAI